MAKFVIQGGTSLQGDVSVQGMKNAVLKLIAATLLTKEECVLRNVPRLLDVERMVELVASLGAETHWDDEHALRIRCLEISSRELDRATVKSCRASIVLFGSLLARLHDVTLPEPGGDNIGRRPLDSNMFALQALGATVEKQNGRYHLSSAGLHGSTIILPEFSVGATENALMAAALTPEETIIKMAALEPSVQELMTFLNTMGAEVREVATHTISIKGKKELGGADHTVAPDNLVAGTFAVAAAATRGEVRIAPVVPFHLEATVEKLKAIGVPVELGEDFLRVMPAKEMRAFKIQTMPFPGFPTDLQAPFGVLATQCTGTSLIHDPLFEDRMGHMKEMIKMGANATICDPHRVLVTGPTPLYGREMPSLDIRAGATLVLAGLVAEGETVIHQVEILDRGYERFAERLAALGADIRRVEE